MAMPSWVVSKPQYNTGLPSWVRQEEEKLPSWAKSTQQATRPVAKSAVNLDDVFYPDEPTAQAKSTPDWAKPGPRTAKLNPLTPGYQEIARHKKAIEEPSPFKVNYLKPNDTPDTIRARMKEKTADPRYGTFLQGNMYRKPLEEQPGFSGFYSAYTMDLPTRLDPETFAKAKEANPLAYNIGRGAGHLTKYATGYGMFGPAIEGIKGLQAISNPFLRTMATEGAKDLIIGGTIGATEEAIQGKSPGEIAKNIPKYLAYDALANLAFYGAGKAFRALKPRWAKRTVEEAAPVWAKSTQEITGETAPRRAKSITMPDDKPLKSMDEAIGKTIKEAAATNVPIAKGRSGNAIIDSARDISSMDIYGTDVYRNFERVFGQDFPEVKRMILDPFDAGKTQKVKFEEGWLNSLKDNVVDKLGITKGSKMSALVQQYGEKQISLNELQKAVPNDWQKVVEADKWFRNAYDELLSNVNTVRAQIYPTNPEKLIPKRQDYYRHFRELSETIGGLKNTFETPANIDPKLVGISEFTKPKTKWQSFAQRRGIGEFKNDAVGGFLEYLPSASYGVHIDPHMNQFKKLAAELAEKTGDSKHLNNFITFLNRYSQDLAGKTNPIDRIAQEALGRKVFRGLDWLNRRTKMNVILGNMGSAMSQLGNVPQGIGYAKQYSIPGMKRTLMSMFDPNPAIKQSGFVLERFAGRMYKQFDTRLIDQPIKFATWMMEQSDKIGTEFIWNSVYEKAIAEGIQNPIKHADDITRKMVAGRSIGEVPLGQKSRLVQMFMPFTLEVGNLWKVQKEFLKSGDIAGLVTLYLATFTFNEVMEKTRGTRVVLDPIDAIRDAFFSGEELTPLQQGGRIVGEALGNTPGGSFLGSIYPEYGMQVGGVELPTRKQLFGRNDPTRYGTGLMPIKGLQDPMYKLLPPFGGLQAQKTIRGIKALDKGGVYKGDKMSYPVEANPANAAKGLLFGPSGFSESREYYEQNRRPLSELQTAAVETGGSYEDIIRGREASAKEAKFKGELEGILVDAVGVGMGKARPALYALQSKYSLPAEAMNEYINRLLGTPTVQLKLLKKKLLSTTDETERQQILNEIRRISQ